MKKRNATLLCLALGLTSCATWNQPGPPPAGARKTVVSHYDNGRRKDQVFLDEQGDKLRVDGWYSNGVRRVEELYDGKGNETQVKTWWDNGKLMEAARIRHGKKVGMVVTRFRNGRIEAVAQYDEAGKRISYVRYNQRGKVVEGKAPSRLTPPRPQ